MSTTVTPPGAGGSGAPDPRTDLPPAAVEPEVLEAEQAKWTPAKIALWVAIALVGGLAWVMLAIVRGETVNAIWFVLAAVCSYFIAYRFYSKFIERKLAQPDDFRATPAEYKANGRDYLATDRRVLYGHHFASWQHPPMRGIPGLSTPAGSWSGWTRPPSPRPPPGRGLTA